MQLANHPRDVTRFGRPLRPVPQAELRLPAVAILQQAVDLRECEHAAGQDGDQAVNVDAGYALPVVGGGAMNEVAQLLEDEMHRLDFGQKVANHGRSIADVGEEAGDLGGDLHQASDRRPNRETFHVRRGEFVVFGDEKIAGCGVGRRASEPQIR